MTRDQIIQWAREAELAEPRDDASTLPAVYVDALELFAQLARADEREECAKVCEDMHDEDRPTDYAWAIRARGEAV